MKNFYFVGCSVTYGEDLSPEEKTTISFPALISKYHNATFINDGTCGSSNQRISSKVLQNINKYDQMYIQWTASNRFTMYDPKNWYEVNFTHQMVNLVYQSCDYYNIFGKYYFSYWSSVLFEFKTFLERIVMLQSILDQQNQSYLMWCGLTPEWKQLVCDETEFIKNLSSLIDISNFDDTMILQQHAEIQNLCKLINYRNFITPAQFDGYELFLGKFPLGPTGHSLREGEQYVADNILNFERTQDANTSVGKTPVRSV